MATMRDSDYVYGNGAYYAAREMMNMNERRFYPIIREVASKIDFPPMQRTVGGQTAATKGMWRRWTNGIDPIHSTYEGYVEWTGSAEQLVEEITRGVTS